MNAQPPGPAQPPFADHLATVVFERDLLHVPFSAITSVDLLLDDLIAPPAASTAAERQPLARDAAMRRRGGSGRAVLAVDPSPIARKFLAQRLEGMGYQVHTAETGERALAMLGQHAFVIVFTEFVLGAAPVMDGLALCEAVKRRRDHPRGVEPAVVVAAGRISSSDRVRASLVGCDALLTKPLAEPDFIAALGQVDPLFN
jgi:two-component system, cell cycle response regulator